MSSLQTQDCETVKSDFAAIARQTGPKSANSMDPEEATRRRDARALSAVIRHAVPEILTHAKHGAMNLRDGRGWKQDFDRFETLSMEQAKALATSPIGPDHPEFGALVQRTRSAFVAFREMVRRELIGKVNATSDPAALDAMLEHVASRAALTVRSLHSLESALAV